MHPPRPKRAGDSPRTWPDQKVQDREHARNIAIPGKLTGVSGQVVRSATRRGAVSARVVMAIGSQHPPGCERGLRQRRRGAARRSPTRPVDRTGRAGSPSSSSSLPLPTLLSRSTLNVPLPYAYTNPLPSPPPARPTPCCLSGTSAERAVSVFWSAIVAGR